MTLNNLDVYYLWINNLMTLKENKLLMNNTLMNHIIDGRLKEGYIQVVPFLGKSDREIINGQLEDIIQEDPLLTTSDLEESGLEGLAFMFENYHPANDAHYSEAAVNSRSMAGLLIGRVLPQAPHPLTHSVFLPTAQSVNEPITAVSVQNPIHEF